MFKYVFMWKIKLDIISSCLVIFLQNYKSKSDNTKADEINKVFLMLKSPFQDDFLKKIVFLKLF